MEELGKHVRDKERTSKDFLDAEADEYKAQGGQISEHVNDFKRMIMQLSIAGLSLDAETRACLLLGSLPDSWNTLVVSLGNSALEGRVTLAMVINSIFNEEIRRKEFVGITHMPLSRSIGVKAKVENHLSITSQEADPSLGGK